jgi:hypothetical protein
MSNLNCVQILSSYRAVNTLRLGYKNQSVYAVYTNNRSLFNYLFKTHTNTVWPERRMFKYQTWWCKQ